MKKISVLLMLALLLWPSQAFAAETVKDNNFTVINFIDIENQILARNPTVLVNQHLVDSTSYGYASLSNTVSDISYAISGLDTAITNFQASEKYLTYGPFAPTAPPLSPPSSPRPNVGGSFPNLPDNTATLPNDNALLVNENTLLGGVKTNTNELIGLYESSIKSLQANKDSMQKQLQQLQSQQVSLAGTVDQVKLQTEMVNKQLVWTAQSMFTSYNKISLQQNDLANNLAVLQKQLTVATLQQSLGLILQTDVTGLQIKINDLQSASDNLTTQLEMVKGELNLMLGQNYDASLLIQATPSVSDSQVMAVNYDKDVNGALALSYIVRLETKARDTKKNLSDWANSYFSYYDYQKAKADLDGEQAKLDDETRKFRSAFHKSYEDVLTKQKTLNLERVKLQLEFVKLNQLILKHDLGMVSDLEFVGGQATYQSEVIKVTNLESDLELSYTKYQWMLKGLTLS